MDTVQTLSKTTISENGNIVLPKNFDSLSIKKQKALVVEAFRDNLIAINDIIEQLQKTREESKILNQRIKQSKEGRELTKMKKDVKQCANLLQTLEAERMGMLRITKKLGFDITTELKKMKLIEE